MRIRNLPLIAVLLGALLAAPTAYAVTGTPTYVQRNPQLRPNFPYVTWTISSLTNSTIDTTIINVQNLLVPYIGASGVISVALTNAWNSSTAAESCWVALDFGPTSSGPWRSNNAMVANTLSGTIPTKTNAVVATTSPAFLSPYWRIRTIGKGSTVTSARMYLFFPAIGVLPRQQ